MKRIFVLCVSLASWLPPVALGQPGANKKVAALEQGLSAEQKRLLDEWVTLQSSQQIRYFDPESGAVIQAAPRIRAESLELLAAMSSQELKGFWRNLPKSLKQGFRRLNPFYGGQDNRLFDLGPIVYADVKKAPGPDTTAKWWKNHNNGPPITAAVGHVYLLHLADARDKVDFAVKFKVLDLSDDEWIIIEWERIPQEK